MIVKYIRCAVKPGMQDEFDTAQRAWSDLQGEEGFLWQMGGWDRRNEGSALVLGFWQDQEALNRFMLALHDRIVEKNHQEQTYTHADIRLFHHRMDMDGALPDLPAMLRQGVFFRAALCHVHPHAVDAFEKAQLEIWRPGMAVVPGMLGGGFFQQADGASVYLVLTLWDASRSHDAYTQSHLPRLQKVSGSRAQVSTLTGGQTPIEPAWTVHP
jgi:heme-degrading monooxygenase HmoA